MVSKFFLRKQALFASAILHTVTSHTWIDCIGLNRRELYKYSELYIYQGDLKKTHCDGFVLDYVDRGHPDCGVLNTHKILKKDAENGAKVCTGSRTESVIKVKRHLQVRSNERVFYAYLPNGHIAKDKKAIGTKYGVYWTGKPRAEIHSTNEINTTTLIPGSSADFDDGKCGETYDSHKRPSGRGGDGFPCIGEFKIPPNTPPGMYKAVWYWEFWLDDEHQYVDQAQASGYSGASYHSCFEFEVLSDKDESEGRKGLNFDIDVPNAREIAAPVVPPSLESPPKPKIKAPAIRAIVDLVIVPPSEKPKAISPLPTQHSPASPPNKESRPESPVPKATILPEAAIINVSNEYLNRHGDANSPEKVDRSKTTESTQIGHGSC